MGLFSFISNKMNEAQELKNETLRKAERMNAMELVRAIDHSSGSAVVLVAYCSELRNRANSLSRNELVDVFDFAYRHRISKACSALVPAMENQGLGYRDDNGTFHRSY